MLSHALPLILQAFIDALKGGEAEIFCEASLGQVPLFQLLRNLDYDFARLAWNVLSRIFYLEGVEERDLDMDSPEDCISRAVAAVWLAERQSLFSCFLSKLECKPARPTKWDGDASSFVGVSKVVKQVWGFDHRVVSGPML